MDDLRASGATARVSAYARFRLLCGGAQAVGRARDSGVESRRYSRFAGLSHGHGWFRTSDLSRVKRYLVPGENARSACKSVCWTRAREPAFYGVCVCFTGVRATGARQWPIQRCRPDLRRAGKTPSSRPERPGRAPPFAGESASRAAPADLLLVRWGWLGCDAFHRPVRGAELTMAPRSCLGVKLSLLGFAATPLKNV